MTASNIGGIPIPEDILDDQFVMDRLNLEFPNGEDGEPTITIGDEVLHAMNGLWRQCIIVKVLGWKVPVSVLNKRLRELWKPAGEMLVMDLPRQFFMIRFGVEEAYMTALTRGPWKIFGSYLLTQAWTPEFDPLQDEIATTPVWIRLSNLPVNFYHRSILMGIAKGLGRPVKVDLTTLKFERARFARICVEVNLKKPLKGTMMVNGERYFVSYEGLDSVCSKCGMYGHLVHMCPQVLSEKKVTVQQSSTVEIRKMQSDEEFQTIRCQGKKPVMNTSSVGSQEPRVTGTNAGHRKDIPIQKVFQNLATSNRFHELGEHESLQKTGEKGSSSMGKKETLTTNDNLPNRRSVGHENEGNKCTPMVLKNVEFAGVFKGKGAKPSRPNVIKGLKTIGFKTKKKPNKPLRGLIFGPVEKAFEFFESGKRLRIEKEGAGRRGGAFVNEDEER